MNLRCSDAPYSIEFTHQSRLRPQDLMAAATGVNLGAICDPQQRGRLGAGRDSRELAFPSFLVTQSLVSLLTEKRIRYRYSAERAESNEAKGDADTHTHTHLLTRATTLNLELTHESHHLEP